MKKLIISKKTYDFLKLIYRYGGFFTILGLLVGYSWLIGKPIEFIFIFLPYFLTKGLYSKQYHANSLKQCFLLSLGVFSLATTITLPQNFSLLFSLVSGLAIAYGSYYAGTIQLKLKDYAYIEPRYNQLCEWYNESTNKTFNIDSCTKDELIKRCNELKIPNNKIDIIYELFNTPIEIYMEEHHMEYQSVCNKRQRYRDKLNKK